MGLPSALAFTNVFLTGVPDYDWHAGCFGTASGNLIGFWDRHGFPEFYTGPTGGGVAPMDSRGAHEGIRSLWASKAGRDGRPASQPGHEDDYYVFYESTAPDPYVTAGRPEHAPDCIGDFLGLNQFKWRNQNGECDGNLDGYSFTYWDGSGARRVNFTPPPDAGRPPRDLPSGLREFARFRGYESEVFSQLAELNPFTPVGRGFTWADLVAEIEAGYPVLAFLQDPAVTSRAWGDEPRVNPDIHGMLIHGYVTDDQGLRWVRVRTSWGDSDVDGFRPWISGNWTPALPVYLPLRGVIGFHPRPRLTRVTRAGGDLVLRWDAPEAELEDALAGTTRRLHYYVVERATTLAPSDFQALTQPLAVREARVPGCCDAQVFYRVRIWTPPRA